MTKINVLIPTADEAAPASITLAERKPFPEQPVLGIVSNGKPLAKELLDQLVLALEERTGRRFEIVELRKPSAGHSIEQGEARQMAARCHAVISGLGD